jgi:hypothetical protein
MQYFCRRCSAICIKRKKKIEIGKRKLKKLDDMLKDFKGDEDDLKEIIDKRDNISIEKSLYR